MNEFNPDKPFEKHCSYGGPTTYHQDGFIYTPGYKLIGKDDDYKAPDIVPEKVADDGAYSRTAKPVKTNDLEGFKAPERPQNVIDALEENRAAVVAEKLSEDAEGMLE